MEFESGERVETWGLCLRELTWRKITQGDTWHRRDNEKRREQAPGEWGDGRKGPQGTVPL